MKKSELSEVLRLHKLWLQDDEAGVEADLRYANPNDYLEDLGALESFQKELECQQAYASIESDLH